MELALIMNKGPHSYVARVFLAVCNNKRDLSTPVAQALTAR